MRTLFRRYLALTLCLLVVSCGSEIGAPGSALEVKAEPLPEAFIGEEYAANVRAIGGLTPYIFELSDGTLPPGLELQGGTLRGTPTEEGTFSFTITVSDANLSKTFRDYSLVISKAPPARLSLNVPLTEVQRTVVLRGEISEARGLEAFRTLITWNADLFELVPDSIRVLNDAFALFSKADAGQLQLDIAVLGGDLTGERRVFEFALKPLDPVPLQITSSTEFLSTFGGHAYTVLTEGTAPDLIEPPLEELEEPVNPDDGSPSVEGES